MIREITFNVGRRPAIVFIKNKLGDGLVGAEIGVNKGHNAVHICQVLKPSLLYLIDPWDNFIDPDSGEIIGEAQYQATKEIVNYFPCCKVIRKKSSEAINEFKNESLDFGYIDSIHTFEEVLGEMVRWYSKIKPGGVLSGHDFSPDCLGVINAVNFFCQQNKIKYSFEEQDWFFIKR